MMPSLDERRFAASADVDGGEVGADTLFTYHEHGGEIWADYAGGSIRRGHLVGTRNGDALDFRYVQLNNLGRTSTGHCTSVVTQMADGRLRLNESWQWESQEGSGTSVVLEL
jgi:hypothetical protein